MRPLNVRNLLFCTVADKQQELDIPSLRTEDNGKIKKRPGTTTTAAAAAATGTNSGTPSMSHISGVKRPLCHANSFTGEKLPKYGVETRSEADLGEVRTLDC